jgi:hypothetical protein
LLKRLQGWFTTNNNKQKIAMKLKSILACAVGAGLLTFGSGHAQALGVGVINGELVTVLNAQLLIKWTDGNGKIKKARIISKDLVNAISEDFDENFSGDQIVNVAANNIMCAAVADAVADADVANVADEKGDYWLMDKDGNLVTDANDENLTEDGVIVAQYDDLSDGENTGNNGKFKYVETGILDFEFYSDGDLGGQQSGVSDNADSTLAFIDDSVSYTFTETAGPFKNNDLQQVTMTEKDGVSAVGHDFDVIDIDNLPVFGMMTQDGSGKIVPAG